MVMGLVGLALMLSRLTLLQVMLLMLLYYRSTVFLEGRLPAHFALVLSTVCAIHLLPVIVALVIRFKMVLLFRLLSIVMSL